MSVIFPNAICPIILPCGLNAIYFPEVGEQPKAVNDDSFKGEVK